MWPIFFIAFVVTQCSCLYIPTEFFEEWDQFKSQYKKLYLDDMDEASHLQAYLLNKLRVLEHNKLFELGLTTYRQSINQFSDMLHEDFLRLMTGFKPGNVTGARLLEGRSLGVEVADSMDWRDYGYVTRVKNQGQCGSCWAFAATGALEGQHFNKTGQLVSLSDQNLLDCVSSGGCNGGTIDDAFLYVIKNGINSETSYPYEEKERSCRHDSSNNVASATNYFILPQGNEQSLLETCFAHGPISVAVDASPASFQSYEGGIYDDPSCTSANLNHAVLVVGYGSENGRDFWIVKNSWGESWGEKGYIRMIRNKNMCGIASMAVYPVM